MKFTKLTKGYLFFGATFLAFASANANAEAAMEPASEASTDTRRLSELFYQLQVMQQEVQDLRGLVEDQSHQLRRLARDQKEQYIDLDGRVAALVKGGSVGQGPAAPATAPRPAGSTAQTRLPATSPPATAAAASGAERDAYTRAFDLMKTRDFDASADAFNQLIVDYPNGEYAGNSFYWLGELYLAKTETEKARQSFAQVLNLYPGHTKVPDSLYKLGVVYHRLGDTERALQYFDQVQAQHPTSSAAGLATTYAEELR